MEYFDLIICGIKRKLPLIYVGRDTRLASFNLLGDVELVDRLADELAKKLRGEVFDFLVGPEVKVVPLIHGVAKRLGQKKFIICRKSVKPYMVSPVILKPLAHFPKHVRQLVLDGNDALMLKNRKVVVMDDVISTGVTIRMMNKLMEKVGAEVVTTVAVLREGAQFEEIPKLIYLAELPVFKS